MSRAKTSAAALMACTAMSTLLAALPSVADTSVEADRLPAGNPFALPIGAAFVTYILTRQAGMAAGIFLLVLAFRDVL